MAGSRIDDDSRPDVQLTIYVQELTRCQRAPSRILVHPLAGYDDRLVCREVSTACADRARSAGMVKTPPTPRTAR
jgi:hypothetical protein